MRNAAGFTLLEILVAIALTSVLLTSIYGVFSTTSDAQARVEERGEALHLARVLIARLDRELLGLSLENIDQQAALAGGRNGLAEPYLELLSNSGSHQTGLVKIGYRLGPDSEGRATLWRTEQLANSTEKGDEEFLTHGIESLEFTFFDGREWREDWNSLSGGRPTLVRATLKVAGITDMPALTGTFDLPQAAP